jgi:hypothetical protein
MYVPAGGVVTADDDDEDEDDDGLGNQGKFVSEPN